MEVSKNEKVPLRMKSPAMKVTKPYRQRNQGSHFLNLPTELRLEIYKLLLVSDCAYRLGHHGPYCHLAPRKSLHAAVLRTSKAIYAESSAILYGHNTFYLGPLNHKPTYSSSLLQTIGKRHAASVKNVILHCTCQADLSRDFIYRWLEKQGCDIENMRTIAVSQSIPGGCPVAHIPTHGRVILGSQGQQQFLHALSTLLSNAQANTQSNASTPLTQQSVASELERPQTPEFKFLQSVADKMDNWADVVGREEVERYVQVRNSDLRAGELWLVHVDAGVKRRVVAQEVRDGAPIDKGGKGKRLLIE